MTLFSAYEDFVARTLSVFVSSVEKLAYLRELRTQDGVYDHWGMGRRFGEEESSQALAEAHTQVCLEMLRTPLPVLFAHSREYAEKTARFTELENWPAEAEKLTPADLGGGSKRHFNSVLLAVSLLSRAARESSQPAA